MDNIKEVAITPKHCLLADIFRSTRLNERQAILQLSANYIKQEGCRAVNMSNQLKHHSIS